MLIFFTPSNQKLNFAAGRHLLIYILQNYHLKMLYNFQDLLPCLVSGP